MIYIETGSQDVYYNFALEYYFASRKKLDDVILLFWQTAPTLMVGKYQNIYEEIDLAFAKKNGLNIVRRKSGGGTIYTDPHTFQFSVIDYAGSERIQFESYTAPFIKALSRLGLTVDFKGRNDLLIGSRKVSGNAQYKSSQATVHHGSLLFRTDIDMMERATCVDAYKVASKGIKSVRERVTRIYDHLPKSMDEPAFKAYMLSTLLGEKPKFYTLNQNDQEAIREIADREFRCWEKTFGHNPKFNMEKTCYFKGGKFQIKLDVEKGNIAQCTIYGDFFAGEKAESLGAFLIGTPFEEGAIYDRLKAFAFEEVFYNIEIKDVVSGIMY